MGEAFSSHFDIRSTFLLHFLSPDELQLGGVILLEYSDIF